VRTSIARLIIGLGVLAVSSGAGSSARANNAPSVITGDEEHDRDGNNNEVRWDIISVNFTTLTLSPGGNTSAFAQDGSQLELTGSGTFRSDSGRPQDVTGGGNWTMFAPDGITVTGSGTYQVTGFVSFGVAPDSIPQPPFVVNICSGCVPHSGLVTLRIAYSDGSRRVLIVSCMLPAGSPAAMPEGISASKDFVDYWNIPTTGVTLFNFLPSVQRRNSDEPQKIGTRAFRLVADQRQLGMG
jgi:hypothetical protein